MFFQKLATALIFSGLTLLSSQTHAIDHGPIVYGYEMAPISPGRFHLSPNLQFFQTSANYDESGGSFDDLPNDGSYQNISGNLNTAYDLNSHWRILGGVRLAYANSNDGSFDRTSTELNEVTLGVLMTPYYGVSTRIYLEVLATLALNSVEESTDEVITGEGAHSVLGGAKLSQMLSIFEMFASLHVQYFSDGRSMRIPWRVGGLLHLGSFKLIGSVFGYHSIIDDESVDTPADRTAVTQRVNGGSLRYYSVNPSLIDTQAGFGWQPYNDLQFELGLTKTINGESTAEGLGAYLALSLFWGGDDGDTSFRRKKKRKILRKKPKPEERFETKQEAYDESLFENKRMKRQKRRRQSIDIDKAIEDAVQEFE